MSLELDTSPAYLLHRSMQTTTALFEDVLKSKDLTQSQLYVLLSILNNPGVSQKEVSSFTGIDRSTLADVTSRLVRKGLIRRARSRTDARRYNLQLTNVGKQIVDEARPLMSEIDRRLLEGLTPDDATKFVQSLLRILSGNTTAEALQDAVAAPEQINSRAMHA